MPPITVDEVYEIVVQPTDSLGTAIVKTYVRLPVLMYRLWKWMFTAEGDITGEFATWICAGCQALQEAANMEAAP